MHTTTRSGGSVRVNGFALRVVRELIGETQRGLAEGVGVTPQYMNRIEAGRVETISADLFARIVRVMRLTDRRALLADPHPAPVADRVAA